MLMVTGKLCHLRKKPCTVASLLRDKSSGAGTCPHRRARHALPRLNTNAAHREAVTAVSAELSIYLTVCEHSVNAPN